jgi:hypothetical protein
MAHALLSVKVLSAGLLLLFMPGRKKFRIELEDAEGSKYNLSLEGNISKDKILKIVEFMDLLNIEGEGATTTTAHGNLEGEFGRANVHPASVGDRIWALVESKFPYGSFTSSDILELYEDTFNEPIKLSIISTYLSRYAERGRLMRNRQGKEWIYRTAKPAGSWVPEQQKASPSSISYDRLQ